MKGKKVRKNGGALAFSPASTKILPPLTAGVGSCEWSNTHLTALIRGQC